MRPSWAFAAVAGLALPLLLTACSGDAAADSVKQGCELVLSGKGIDEDQLDALSTRAENVTRAAGMLADAAADDPQYAKLATDASGAAADLSAQLQFAEVNGFDPKGWSADTLADYQREFPAARDDPYARLTSACAAVVTG